MATYLLTTETFSSARNSYVPCETFGPMAARDRQSLMTEASLIASAVADKPLVWLETEQGHFVSSNVTIYGVDIRFRVRFVPEV